MEVLERLAAFGERWAGRVGSEQQLSQGFLVELCEALGVARPGPISDGRVYEFEHPVAFEGTSERGRVDLYKQGCFLLEAKCGRAARDEPGSAPVRGTRAYAAYIERAYREQAQLYAGFVTGGPPPLLIVVDIGERFWIWRGFDGRFDGFHSPHRVEIDVRDLGDEDNARILRACFESPQDLDPARYQERITREAVETLAPLAQELEAAMPRGTHDGTHDGTDDGTETGERVARFLMRCLFCMFAEDVDLLPSGGFTKLLHKSLSMPAAFAPEAGRLFRAMDAGGHYDFAAVRRFNGALFRDAEALPLSAAQLTRLAEAAAKDWSLVDPAIFGTLLERALDPVERHRLGAHFTPRHYVERLVRATIQEPLGREWEAVQARAHELLGEDLDAADAKARGDALKLFGEFHRRLCHTRILDPACGTGNFLYVSYVVLKALEHEVLEAMRVLGGAQAGLAIEGASVLPAQLHGLEVKPWAAEIAQLVLWIGHLQWELRHRGPDQLHEPILSEERTIECRDALIEWERSVPRVDAGGEPVTRWDGRTTRTSPTTGKEVPDERAQVPVFDYEGVRRATWPDAEYIVGNPPFIGNKHMREVLGDAYVDAVRGAYGADVPNTVDFVTYWWHRAAELARRGAVRRFGFITTNTLRQSQNRVVVQHHLGAEPQLRLVMAVPDHPWVDDGADVRIAMTVGEGAAGGAAELARLAEVAPGSEQAGAAQVHERIVATIHSDLRAGVDAASAVPLRANEGVSFQGMNLVGQGFRLTREQVVQLGYDPEHLPPVVRPYLNAREMMQTREHRYVIDAFGYTADELQEAHPTLYQWLYDHVKPERDQNRRKSYADRWWIFGEARGKLRAALDDLDTFIATPRVSKHRAFQRFSTDTVPDCQLVALALPGATPYGVLLSRAHRLWSLRAAGAKGVGNTPTYDHDRCFLTFPFPAATGSQLAAIGAAAEAIERHLADARSRAPEATLTGIYNLVDKRRDDAPLSAKERDLHATLATDVLIGLHDALDAAVLGAYGLPADIDDDALLAALLELNAERAAEEARGQVRWLRPDRAEPVQTGTAAAGPTGTKPAKAARTPWPTDPFDQVAAVLAHALAEPGPFDAATLASGFSRATKKRVASILETLAARRLLLRDDTHHYRRPTPA